MQTIDHQIEVEITVIMLRVGDQQHTCCHHAATLVAPLLNSEQTISLPEIILTQSRRQITSVTTMPPLQHPPSLQLHPHTHHIVTPWICGQTPLE